MEAYPIDKVREEFPALQRIENEHFVAYFDGPGSTQVTRTVIESMATYMKTGVANPGGVYKTTRETAMILSSAREHVAALIATEKENITFGPNMSTLALKIARLLGTHWNDPGKNLVVTEIDHESNVEPWITVAKDKNLEVRVIKCDPKTMALDTSEINQLINEETELVAVSLASNVFGTVNDLKLIIERAREVDALIVVDAVHAIPHFSIDFEQLNVNFLFGSAHKFFGPHIGFVAMKDAISVQNNQRIGLTDFQSALETGATNYEGLVGVIEAIKFIASLGKGSLLREQLLNAYENIEQYEANLAQRLRSGLAEIEHVTLLQAGDDIAKTPTIAFRVEGMEAKMVCYHLAQDYGLHLEYGNFNSKCLIKNDKQQEKKIVRAGIVLYNTIEEVDRLIHAIHTLK